MHSIMDLAHAHEQGNRLAAAKATRELLKPELNSVSCFRRGRTVRGSPRHFRAKLAINVAASMPEDINTASLYSRILGPALDRLPEMLRAVHDHRSRKQYAGRCRVQRGPGWLANFVATMARLPDTSDDMPVTVLIESNERGETWTRMFGSHRMRSTMRVRTGALEESLGLTTLTFGLRTEGDSILWTLQRARLLFLPVPLALFDGTRAQESLVDGRYCFDVRAALGGRLLIHYQGWLADHE